MPNKLKVIFCWHLHQPVYRDWQSGQYQLPWTYLHGIKDYVDMVAHLEAVPDARVVINLVPVLLEQIEDYAQQISQFWQTATPLLDPLLAALVTDPPYAPWLNHHFPHLEHKKTTSVHSLPPQHYAKMELLRECLRAHPQHLIQRFQPYHELAELAEMLKQSPTLVNYLDDYYFSDLVVWYHLAWLGETVRRAQPLVQTLMNKGRGYTLVERQQLLGLIGRLIASIIPRYQALAQRGQIELSFTPYAHPIMPLFLNVQSAREALPEISLPVLSNYDDGEARMRWHLQAGLATFERLLQMKPQGCWPSEGSLSEATVRLLEEFGIRWVASGESVLRKSLNKAGLHGETTYRSYHLSNSTVQCFFRDDKLSDLVGLEYSTWNAAEAVDNLLCQLENIAKTANQSEAQVVSIILDGENAWELYPDNGYDFLSRLYQRLVKHPQLELTTFADCLNLETAELPVLVAGSWVYGTFSTWIGEADKNRGWQMLDEAKQKFDELSPQLTSAQRILAERQLAICEGSDWCWWFGDYNPAVTVREFEQLYRLHLISLYHLLKTSPPSYLLI